MIKVHKMKLHTKYQRPGPSSYRQEDFYSFAFRNQGENFHLSVEKVKVNLRLSFFFLFSFPTLLGLCRSA